MENRIFVKASGRPGEGEIERVKKGGRERDGQSPDTGFGRVDGDGRLLGRCHLEMHTD